MFILHRLLIKFKALFQQSRIENDLDEEMRFHLEMETEVNVRKGMSPKVARHTALKSFGGMEQSKEDCRETWGVRMMINLLRDIRHSFKVLWKDKGFTFTVLLTLGLCIGGNAAIFPVLNTFVLRPPLVNEPEKLVEIYNTYPKLGWNKVRSSLSVYVDYLNKTDAFKGLTLFYGRDIAIMHEKALLQAHIQLVTISFFEVFGANPFMGRFFQEENDLKTNPRVTVLGYAYWQNTFHEDPQIVGKTVEINGQTHTIIGVASPAMETIFPWPDLYVPWHIGAETMPPNDRHGNYAKLAGRLRSGVTIAEAKAQVESVDQTFFQNAELGMQKFIERSGHVTEISNYQKLRIRVYEPFLYLIQVAVLFVLVIGAANIVSLLLARSNARRLELRTRRALGATGGAIVRQLFIENLLLSFAGGIVGLLGGWLGLHWVNYYILDKTKDLQSVQLDSDTLFYTLWLSICMAVLICILPVFKAFKMDGSQTIHLKRQGVSRGRRFRVVSSILVFAQVAFSLMLLIGAGLLIHSFSRVMAADSGFDSNGVIVANFEYPNWGLERSKTFRNKLLRSLRQIPGIESVCLTKVAPQVRGGGGIRMRSFGIEGHSWGESDKEPVASYMEVTPGFFKTLNIPLKKGRVFKVSDINSKSREIIIDQKMVDKYFPSQDPLGQRLIMPGIGGYEEEGWPIIIGVVNTIRPHRQDRAINVPMIYCLIGEGSGYPYTFSSILVDRSVILLKTDRIYHEIFPVIRETIHSLASEVSLYSSGPMEFFIDERLRQRRFVMIVLGTFAGLALILSAIGISGVLAHDVSQRVREIGIRRALGATRVSILRLIIGQGLIKVMIGLFGGLVAAYFLSRLMVSQLYEVRPTDPLVFVFVPLVLFFVAFLASYLPARRAVKISPAEALRYE